MKHSMKQTIALMLSPNGDKRLVGEYWQVKLRLVNIRHLIKMVKDQRILGIDLEQVENQAASMYAYRDQLKIQARTRGINLKDPKWFEGLREYQVVRPKKSPKSSKSLFLPKSIIKKVLIHLLKVGYGEEVLEKVCSYELTADEWTKYDEDYANQYFNSQGKEE